MNLHRIVYITDTACIENTRMDRRSFHSLCDMMKTIGMLQTTSHMGVEEQVAIFLHILAHDVKNRVTKRQFMRSGETISRQFNKVLLSVLRCHTVLLKRPDPILQNSTDDRWKWFKNCLGDLDGTHIKVNPLQADKARYCSRKGEIATNVLGVCSQDCQFIYVLPGWEGSAADSKVLRDAISRGNGLRVPKGNYRTSHTFFAERHIIYTTVPQCSSQITAVVVGFYYLADAGYMNGEGFLTPYRGQRYHLSEWRHGAQPTTPQEFFNMKHSQARNVIERCFGLLKGRWAIVRSKSFYPVKTQCRIITACCLLHNHIRNEMPIDPLEDNTVDMAEAADNFEGQNLITHVESSNAWTRWRDDLAQQMFDTWRNGV
ncbi:protein ALP1-like [Gastrolobium bilobum]|uniref:protein ALP1-like n=1 Tax=Gastrolobium bilobum TaxID=150636 RepID=UPI002AB1AC68|nr:protein ALP1-like [Gastrolobium bilobum]